MRTLLLILIGSAMTLSFVKAGDDCRDVADAIEWAIFEQRLREQREDNDRYIEWLNDQPRIWAERRERNWREIEELTED